VFVRTHAEAREFTLQPGRANTPGETSQWIDLGHCRDFAIITRTINQDGQEGFFQAASFEVSKDHWLPPVVQ
jgi:hypothetical protein